MGGFQSKFSRRSILNGFHIYKYGVVTRNFRILLVVAEILIWGILFNTSKNKTKKLLTKQKSKI